MTKQQTVGVVGAGTIAVNTHLPVLRSMPQARVAFVADVDPARTEAVARAYGLPPHVIDARKPDLPPCDVVLLAIPLHVRQDYFDRLAPTSTAILAEKPFALDANEHRRVSALYDSWRLAVGYQRRHYATSLLLRTLIDRQPFGPLRRIRVREGGRVTRSGGESYIDKSVAEGGGLVKNLGCHSLDLAIWLTRATAVTLSDRRIEWDGSTDRHATARIDLSAENLACELDWTVSWLETQPNTIELEFSNARVKAPVTVSDAIEIHATSGQAIGAMSSAATGGATTINQAFYLEWAGVLEGVGKREASSHAASTSLPVAVLMDELLQR